MTTADGSERGRRDRKGPVSGGSGRIVGAEEEEGQKENTEEEPVSGPGHGCVTRAGAIMPVNVTRHCGTSATAFPIGFPPKGNKKPHEASKRPQVVTVVRRVRLVKMEVKEFQTGRLMFACFSYFLRRPGSVSLRRGKSSRRSIGGEVDGKPLIRRKRGRRGREGKENHKTSTLHLR